MDTWTCHARPAHAGGVSCGAVNPSDALVCSTCGCTRKASWDREMHAHDNALRIAVRKRERAALRKRLQRHTW